MRHRNELVLVSLANEVICLIEFLFLASLTQTLFVFGLQVAVSIPVTLSCNYLATCIGSFSLGESSSQENCPYMEV